jgi:hypothetical protein
LGRYLSPCPCLIGRSPGCPPRGGGGLTGSGPGRSGLGFAGVNFGVLELSSCVYSGQPKKFAGWAPPQFTQEGGSDGNFVQLEVV